MNALSPSSQALLQAVVAPDVNPQALERWLAATSIERLEPGQFHLLPLVYRQLEQRAADHPWLPRVKGVYRRTWVANQLALRAASDALHVLEAARVPALLVGPAALALTVYADPATRPIDAAQVLTPMADRLAAIQALTAAGWQPSPPTVELAAVRYERWQAGHLFNKPVSAKERLQVRLCWHALPSAPRADWGAHWFDCAAPLSAGSLQARTLDPTDQLLQSLAAAPASELTPLVDAQRLICQRPIDWSRFVRLAQASRLTRMIGERLAHIQALGTSCPPDCVLAELRQAASPAYASEAWRLEQINPWERSVWQRFRLNYAVFRQRAAAQGVAPHPGNYYDFLRTQFATDALAATVRRGLGRAAKRPPLPHGY